MEAPETHAAVIPLGFQTLRSFFYQDGDGISPESLECGDYSRTVKILGLADQDDIYALENEFYKEAAARLDSSSADLRGTLKVWRCNRSRRRRAHSDAAPSHVAVSFAPFTFYTDCAGGQQLQWRSHARHPCQGSPCASCKSCCRNARRTGTVPDQKRQPPPSFLSRGCRPWTATASATPTSLPSSTRGRPSSTSGYGVVQAWLPWAAARGTVDLTLIPSPLCPWQYKTHTKKKTLDPVFDEHLVLDTIMAPELHVLRVAIHDYDMFSAAGACPRCSGRRAGPFFLCTRV